MTAFKWREAPDDAPVTFSRVMRIDGERAGASAEDDLLTLAKARATDPAVFDEYPPFFFPAQISSNRWDAYDTRMGPSTLKNYAAEAVEGVAFLRNHDTSTDPLGGSLTGSFTGAQGNGVAQVRSDFFILPDPESAPYVAKIRAGVVRDVSVGFYGGEWLCSICGRDMQDWYSRDGCPHLLGMTYTPKEEAGTKSGDPQVARATIENAHLAEVSGVYSGATPGAMIEKARALASDGLLDTRMHDLVQVRYKVRLPGGSRVHAVPDLGRPNSTATEETMTPEERVTELETERTGLLSQLEAQKKTAESVRAIVATVKLPEGHAATGDLVETIRFLSEDRARLSPLADDGRSYRADLIDAALAEGVRAYGKDFEQEQERDMLERSTLAQIKLRSAQWAKTAAAVFPGGRHTTDGEQRPDTSPTSAIPAEAYRSGR